MSSFSRKHEFHISIEFLWRTKIIMDKKKGEEDTYSAILATLQITLYVDSRNSS